MAGKMGIELKEDNEVLGYVANTTNQGTAVLVRKTSADKCMFCKSQTAILKLVPEDAVNLAVAGFGCPAELPEEETNALMEDTEIPETLKLFKRAGVGAEAMEIVVHGGMLGPGIGSFPIVGALALRLRTMGLMKTVRQLECTMRAYVEEFDLQDKKRSLQAQSPGGRSALQDEARGSSESKVMLGILCEQQVLLHKATEAVATGVDRHNAIMEAQGEAASAVKVNRLIQSKIEKALSEEVSGFASAIGSVAAMNEVTAETWAKLAAATCRSASEGGAPGAAATSMFIEFVDKLQEVLGRSVKEAVQAELA
mmetsp:Transcript_9927/g.19894  ORF Transcript_9927/g.19894 Transcript_9927/m.19894 type:complete len:311 (+) Transcript_9927:117-1049(+)